MSIRRGPDAPYGGIQIYDADVGAPERQAFDSLTGAVRTFVSGWDRPRRG